MREGWKLKILGEIAEVQSGGTPLTSRNEYWLGNIPWYSSGELDETFTKTPKQLITPKGLKESNAKLFPKGSLLIGMYDTAALKMSILDRDAAFNQAIAGVRPNENIDLKFILFAINSRRFEILNLRRGVRQKNLSLAKIKNIALPIPPLPEQKRIVAILDEAFEGIDRAIANTEKNLANSRELFETYLNAIFTQKGEGWRQNKLSEVCEKITDGTHQTPKYFESGVVFLSSRNVTSGTIDWDKIKYIDDAQHIAMQKRVSPRLHDILLAKNGTTGVAALVDKDIDFDIYVSLALLRPLPIILPRFMLHFVNSPVAKEQFNKRLKGIGVPNLHLEEIREVTIFYPQDLALQEVIVVKIDEMRSQILRLEAIYHQKIAALNELKQSILQKAFTGELTADTPKTVKEKIAA